MRAHDKATQVGMAKLVIKVGRDIKSATARIARDAGDPDLADRLQLDVLTLQIVFWLMKEERRHKSETAGVLEVFEAIAHHLKMFNDAEGHDGDDLDEGDVLSNIH